MRIRYREVDNHRQPHLEMSSLIDVVFLLLVFFVMTFQVTAVEGDIDVSMANGAAPTWGEPPRQQLFLVRLAADANGTLQAIQFDGRTLQSIDELRSVVRDLVSICPRDELAVQLHCDKRLRYQATMDAVTAIRGSDPSRPLIHDIRFANAK